MPKPKSTVLIIPQVLILGVLVFGDIGFDRPGRFGLDFFHFLLLGPAYLVMLVLACGFCLVRKQFALVALQLLLPVLGIKYLSLPPPLYLASEYQHLVMQPWDEVKETLERKATREKTISDPAGAIYVVTFNGMKVTYSGHRTEEMAGPSRTILKVEPSPADRWWDSLF